MNVMQSLGKFYRVFRWFVLAGALIVLLLILNAAAPPEVSTDAGAAQRVEFKIYQLESAVNAGESHTLALNEAELNTFLRSNLVLKGSHATPAEQVSQPAIEPTLAEVQSSVRDVRINLIDDHVRAYVLFDFHGKDLSLILEGRLQVVDGYLRMLPSRGTLGSLPIPQATLDNAVARLFDSPENREKFRVPPHISDIRVENGELLVLVNQ